jgi:segregation and condensation protein B
MSEEVRPGATAGPSEGAGEAPFQSPEAPFESSEAPDDGGEPLFEAAASEAALEALLFVAERPLARSEIARLFGCDRGTVDALVGDLETTLLARGVRLVAAGDHVALATAPETGPVIARYVGVEPGRLSPASLEALAIVAYRQPVTKAVVERIRGVDSDYTLRSLLHRRLVVEMGRADAPGRPILYGTGIDFLERFGLASLEDLPPLDAPVAGRLVDVEETAADGAGTVGPDAATLDAAAGPDRAPRADA